MAATYKGLLAFACIVAALCPSAGRARADEVLVSAAASLTDALGEIGRAYTRAHHGTTIRLNVGASGALEQQILQGAPVDVFAPASLQEMDALERRGRIEPATRTAFAGNTLVLVAPSRSPVKAWGDLRAAGVRRIALSNPAFVPSGRYAQQTLAKRGLWRIVQPKAILGDNVRQTLAYVASGDVDAGIVFGTDARMEARRVRVVDHAEPGKDHQAIVYQAAVVEGAPNAPAARSFVAFLNTPTAQAILRRYGFTRIDPPHVRRPARKAGKVGP